jgi:hypothetical protein
MTHWTAIEQVHAGQRPHAHVLIGELLKTYWKLVYCCRRHWGFGNEEAKDLIQDFFQDVVLGLELIQSADRAKGRFRMLLLMALDRATGTICAVGFQTPVIPSESQIRDVAILSQQPFYRRRLAITRVGDSGPIEPASSIDDSTTNDMALPPICDPRGGNDWVPQRGTLM